MRKLLASLVALAVLFTATACRKNVVPLDLVTMVIENNPTNLDPRIGTDAASEHIDSLIFDPLVRKDSHYGMVPALAESWETPDPLTCIFHLRSDVHFHDGRPLTSRDVKWTLDSMMQGKVTTIKAASFATWANVEASNPYTLIVHLKKPDNAMLLNVSDGAFGVVPAGSGRDFWKHPIGSGPFMFVSQEQDRYVLLHRAPSYWQRPPKITGVRFNIVPDEITRALELQKGSADVEINALPADMLAPLARNPRLRVISGQGSQIMYLVMNTRDPKLKDPQIRRAIAEAINRPLMIDALYAGRAQVAESVLPPGHWARDSDLPPSPYAPAHANRMLDEAGYPRGADGVRFHLTIKTSTDETARLIAVVMQQQLAHIGIALEIRSYEFATFYSDITKGAFQMAPLRWVGGNEAPDIFRYQFASESFPPHGANRGFYSNPAVDALLANAAIVPDQASQRRDYVAVQRALAHDLPVLNLWYMDTVAVESTRLSPIQLSASGNFDFLRDVSVVR
jgi:peptide/nickel transport system substrate-binding protein